MTFPIYVWDFSPETTHDNVKDFFDYCGKISQLTELSLQKDGKITKVLQLDFEDENAIQLARLLHRAPLEGTPISVSESFPTELGEAVDPSAAASDDSNKPSESPSEESSQPKESDEKPSSTDSTAAEVASEKKKPETSPFSLPSPTPVSAEEKAEKPAPKPSDNDTDDNEEEEEDDQPQDFFSAFWKSTKDFTNKTVAAVKTLDAQYKISESSKKMFNDLKQSASDTADEMKQTYQQTGLQERMERGGQQLKENAKKWKEKAMTNETVQNTVSMTKKGLSSFWKGLVAVTDQASKMLMADDDADFYDDDPYGFHDDSDEDGSDEEKRRPEQKTAEKKETVIPDSQETKTEEPESEEQESKPAEAQV